MLKKEIADILSAACQAGWVLEPEAKRLLAMAGLEVTQFRWASTLDDALRSVKEIGYPVVAKVVSCKVIHKSDLDGVVVGIDNNKALTSTYERFSTFEDFAGMLVEEMVSGIELIIGAKIDYQFGPVILLGLGGTGVEIYKDVVLRMAPLAEKDVDSMVKGLKAHQLLEGYRGSDPINQEELIRMMIGFSDLVMELEDVVESIDLNPVMCSSKKCAVADARIMLNREKAKATE
ncbi:MAG: acetate--CoA ligase family protein [Desulfobacteraceae bacterium]